MTLSDPSLPNMYFICQRLYVSSSRVSTSSIIRALIRPLIHPYAAKIWSLDQMRAQDKSLLNT